MGKKKILATKRGVEMIMGELQAMKRVEHAFVVRMHFAFQDVPQSVAWHVDRWANGRPCICIGLSRVGDGEQLFQRLKHERTFPIERVKLYAAEIGLALGHLHSHDIVWRGGLDCIHDLDNVLLDECGHVLLGGFRSSQRVRAPDYLVDLVAENQRMVKISMTEGYNEYISPEALMALGHGKPVDWWWLGNAVFEMLTGLPPFYSRNRNRMFEQIFKGALCFPPSFPVEAKSLVEGLLARDPGTRLGAGPGDVKELEAHAFFAGLDLAKVERKEYTPIYAPTIDEDFRGPVSYADYVQSVNLAEFEFVG